MKRLLLILILTFSFQTLSKADDIRDFEIEGISIGDSLLKIFTENEILSNIVDYNYKSDKFTIFEIDSPSKFENYESLQVAFLKKDKNFIIYSISAAIFYDNKIDQCEKKKEIVFKALKKTFKNTNHDKEKDKLSGDTTGKSTYTRYAFYFPDSEFIGVSCYDWVDKWTDNLRVEIYSNKYNNWLNNEAY